MSDALDKALDYKERLETKQQELARAEGELKQMMKELDEYGVKDLSEADRMVKKLENTITKLKHTFTLKLKTFTKRFGKKLEAVEDDF